MSLDVKEKTQVRLVFMGAAGVGKTSLIRRFLNNSFEAKHKRTVEELHSKEYEFSGVKVTLEILDTSGSYSFPAMRKLSIRNGDAFALIYSIDDAESLETVKNLRNEILEVKENKFTPIVVVGNKTDREKCRQVSFEDVLARVELDWNNNFLETSAKENEHVMEVFKELLQQTNLPKRLSPALRRRRETYPQDVNFPASYEQNQQLHGVLVSDVNHAEGASPGGDIYKMDDTPITLFISLSLPLLEQ